MVKDLKGTWMLWGPTWGEGPVIVPLLESRVFAMTGAPLERVESLQEGVLVLHSARGWVMAEAIQEGTSSKPPTRVRGKEYS